MEVAMQTFFDGFFSFLTNIYRAFEIRHLIDIGILSYGLYKLLWMLRSTSSGRVFRGIIILLVALWLSSTLRLYALNYLLGNVLEWGLVVIVVLFQPEIRRFLERMGSSRLGINLFIHNNEEKTPDIETAIAQTVEAYTTFSKDKVGALMVFERGDLLDDVIKTGSHLDCAVTQILLQNLFWNKAPLHDGAVIVRNGRIVGAGCMLPLSSNSNLSRDLGMRHRAGIGISEHSDALVVIVSEENGSISVATGGMLKRHLAPETLTSLMKNDLLAQEKTEKKPSSISGLFHKGKKEEETS
ncbi:MAG: diadenylate cyclase CdaA [Eubacteriales bacterium]